MKKSCGIIIVNEYEQIFMGHSTGNKFYDIPKGGMEEGEEPIDAAIRECIEETSLVFKGENLIDLGEFSYNKEKRIHLFLTSVKKADIKFEELKCESYFEHFMTKKSVPEVDGFIWMDISPIEFDNKCAKSMARVLKNLLGENKLSVNNDNKTDKKSKKMTL